MACGVLNAFRLFGHTAFEPCQTSFYNKERGYIVTDKPTFPETGLVRLSQILAPIGPIPVSRSTWWQGVKDGRFPKPQKLGPRTTVWRVEQIRALFEGDEDA